MSLLGNHRLVSAAEIGHLDLLTLLTSGIPLSLPGGEQLILGVLRPDSPCVGKPIESGCLTNGSDDAVVVAILRQGRALLPRPATTLQAEDRVILIVSEQIRERLSQHLAPLPPETSEPAT